MAENFTKISEYVQSLIGKDICVKLHNDYEYKGNLVSIDSKFYILLQDITEINTGKKFKNMLLRGNMVYYIYPIVN